MLQFAKLETSKSAPESDASAHTILVRKLPLNTSLEALRSMLLFAKDLIDVDFVPSEHAGDQRHVAALARFKTPAGAHEAKDRLNGKSNAAGDANMVVEIVPSGASLGAFGGRRRTVDLTAMGVGSGGGLGLTSPTATNGGRQSSRYNGTFQSLEKLSPPSAGEPFPQSDVNGIFSPRSPLGAAYSGENRGKAVINDDVEDDTGRILANPVEFAKNGESGSVQMPASRRLTNPAIPVSAFAGLSLNTNGGPGAGGVNSYASPRNMSRMPPMQSPPPSGISSPRSQIPSGPGGASNLSGPQSAWANVNPYTNQRHPNYPPVNPADQNPPCNTLYVGNLPLDTSEDELKAMFSKQRGYKRLCFRTKQNGPMCFVEFEDISFATKALNELYGQPLHNSVKGGIRLSFSKNPLGVRTGQTGANGGLPGQPGLGSMGGISAPPGFAGANGPPPGLGAPPGLASPLGGAGVPPPGAGAGGNGMGMHPAFGWGGSPPMNNGVGGGGVPFVHQGMRPQPVPSGMAGPGGNVAFQGMGAAEYGYGLR